MKIAAAPSRSVCFVILALMPSLTPQAQAMNWNGGTGDWFTDSNWNVGAVPNSGDEAYIDGDPPLISGSAAQTFSASVGNNSTGSLQISNGGSLNASVVYIGRNQASSGTVTVTGSNSVISASINFTIGLSGTGTLTVTSGGALDSQNLTLILAKDSGSKGTLQIGNGGAAGFVLNTSSITGKSGDAEVIFNHTDSGYVFNTPLTGSLKVTHSGTGTTILTGANTYTGSTTINAGTLQIGNGGTAGSLRSHYVVDNGALAFNRSDAITIGNSISGTGDLRMLGSGTLTLTGSNSYTGFTTVSNGSLVVANDYALGPQTSPYSALVDGSNSVLTVNNGITLAKVLRVENDATINNKGTMIGSSIAVFSNDSALHVINTGTITADEYAIDANTGTVLNDGGTINGYINIGSNGTVTNQAGGVINEGVNNGPGLPGVAKILNTGSSQMLGGASYSSGDLTNTDHSLIQDTDDTAVYINVGNPYVNSPTLTNSGTSTISGLDYGVYATNEWITGYRTVINNIEGSIIQSSTNSTWGVAGIYMDSSMSDAQGTVNNGVGASIIGRKQGIYLSGGGSVTNDGTITRTLAGGSKNVGVLFEGDDVSTLVNNGTINGGVLMANYANVVTLGVGSLIDGNLNIGTKNTARLVLNGTGSQLYSAAVTGTTTLSGTLVKQGAGTWIVDRNFASNRSVSITGGTLQIGNGGTVGSFAGNATDAGVLAFNRSDSLTYSGVVSGTGALWQSGSGTLVLTGSNTYSGGTKITSGTLSLGSGGTTGSINGNVANGGVLVFNRSNALTFSGAISGTGSLRQIASGTATLSGASTYSGATSVTAGRLRAGAANTFSANSAHTVNSGATLDLNNFSQTIGSLAGAGSVTLGTGTLTTGGDNTGTTFSGTISGNGVLLKSGLGTLVLTGTNTHLGGTTLSSGTLQIGNGGSAGSIIGNVTDNAALVFNRSDDISFGGLVSGTGTLTKRGAGSLTLSTDNTYSGGTRLEAGTLVVASNAALGAGPLALTSGTLAGTGSTTIDNALTIEGDIAILPGTGSINTLTLTGDADLSGGGRTLTLVPFGFATAEFSGAISNDNGGGLTLIRSGSSGVPNFVFSGSTSNTYTGLTTVGTGVLLTLDKTDDATAIAGDLTIADGGQLTVASAGQIADTSRLDVNGSGILQLGSSGGVNEQIGSLYGDGNVRLNFSTSNGKLTVGSGDFSGNITGGSSSSSGLIKTGTGTLTLSGSNSYKGALTLQGGTVSVNSDQAIGSGSVTFKGGALQGTDTFTVNRLVNLSDGGGTLLAATGQTLTFTRNFTQLGSERTLTVGDSGNTGTVVLTGTANHAGATTVAGGTLLANGLFSGASTVTVKSGATLGGSGIITGGVEIENGGILSAGNSPGTLTVGSLTLNTNSVSNFQLGTASDLVAITGDLTLDGLLNLSNSGGFANTGYTLFTYGGALTNHFLELNTVPAGWNRANFTLDLSQEGIVSLLVDNTATIQYWNGASTPSGGSGTWDNTTDNWADRNGSFSSAWAGAVGVFGGTAGTVTVVDDVAFSQLQFETDGYRLTPGGGSLLASGTAAQLYTGAGVTATLSASVVTTGSANLLKTGLGTLVLSGSNAQSAASTTEIFNGTLVAANNNAFGAGKILVDGTAATLQISGGIEINKTVAVENGATVDNRGAIDGISSTLNGARILNSGIIGGIATAIAIQGGPGVLVNGGTINGDVSMGGFANAVTLNTGSQINGNLNLGTQSGTTLTLSGTGAQLYSLAVTGTTAWNGSLVKEAAGLWTLDQALSHNGGTGIRAGTLQAAVTGALGTGDVGIDGGGLQFLAGTDAQALHLTAKNGRLDFLGDSSAGSAEISGLTGGIVAFSDTATADNATIFNKAGSTVDLSGHTGGLAIGHLEGAGAVSLGSETVTLGGLNREAEISGVIRDGGNGGALVKTGTATLTLSGTNTYAGGTTIGQGVLRTANSQALGTGNVTLRNSATLNPASELSIGGDFLWNGGAIQQALGTTTATIHIGGALDNAGGGHEFTLSAGSGFAANTAYTLLTFGSGANFDIDLLTGNLLSGYSGLTPTFVNTGANTVQVLYLGAVSGPLLQNSAGIYTPKDRDFRVTGNVATGAEAESNEVLSLTFAPDSSLRINNTLALGNGHLAVEAGDSAIVGGVLTTAESFTLQTTGNLTVSSLLTGAPGGLLKSGTGTLTLLANNSYTGGTTVAEGTVRAENTKALGNGPVTLNAGATLATAGRLEMTSFTWNSGGILSLAPGTGGLFAIGGEFVKGNADQPFVFSLGDAGFAINQTYTLVTFGENIGFNLSDFAANTFYGITPVFQFEGNALTLHYTGAVTGPVLQNSATEFTPLDANFVVSGPVTTGGAEESNTVNSLLFENGSRLQVHNTLTVTSGNFTVPGGSATLAGDGIVTPGDWNKLGQGVLVSNASLTVHGATNVTSGGLLVNGRLTAAQTVTVFQNALLGGSGVIDGKVVNKGILSPGNSPGTLTIAGDYTQTGSGVFVLQIAGLKNFDRLLVSGAASLAGALNVVPYHGFELAYGQQFTFLKAGKMAGAFDRVNLPAGFRARILTADGDATLLAAPESYRQAAVTPNQKRTAKALDAYIPATGGDREAISIALDKMNGARLLSAFDQIAPAFHETPANITLEQSNSQGQMLQQRFGAIRLGSRGFSQTGLDAPVITQNSGKTHTGKDLKEGRDIMESNPANPWGVWIQGDGLFARNSSLNNLPNYHFNSGQFLLGADYRWNEAFATGLYSGYQRTEAHYAGGGGTRIDAARFGAYATLDTGHGFYANALVGGGHSSYDTRRSIDVGTLERTAKADPEGNEFTAMLGSGYDWLAGNFTFGPVASGQYTRVAIGSFAEQGADSLNLRLDRQTAESLQTTLGARVAYTWKLGQNVALTPEGRLTWQHEFLRDSRTLEARLDGGSGPGFAYSTTAPAKDSLLAAAGFNLQLGDRWNTNLYYTADLGRGDFKSQMVSGGFNWSF